MMEFTLKKIKTFIGMEGYGLNAEMYIGSKNVAFVRDDASGGEIDFDFHGKTTEAMRENERLVWDFVKKSPDSDYVKEMRVSDYWKKYPKAIEYHKLNEFVNCFVDNFQTEKRQNRERKTKVLFTTSESKDGQYFTVKHNNNIERTKEVILQRDHDAIFI